MKHRITGQRGRSCVDNPAQRILKYIKSKGITQSFLAREAGIDDSVLNSKLHNKTKIWAEEIELFCGILGVDPNTFLSPKLPEEKIGE